MLCSRRNNACSVHRPLYLCFHAPPAPPTLRQVGMAMATWGGTALESWMSEELLFGAGGGSDGTHGICPVVPSDPTTVRGPCFMGELTAQVRISELYCKTWYENE